MDSKSYEFLDELEEKIKYHFSKKELLVKSLTHASYINEHKLGKHQDGKLFCNERLEFLGDSVLSLISSEFLYEKYPDKEEGYLTKLKAKLVCSQTLASFSRHFSLGEFLILGKSLDSNGRNTQSILENAFEALIAAIYLDSNKNLKTVKSFLIPLLDEKLKEIIENDIEWDYKTIFQQFIQSQSNDKISYVCIGEHGPDHDKTFEFEVKLNSNVVGKGTGKTKKEAEQNAAKNACILFDVKWDI